MSDCANCRRTVTKHSLQDMYECLDALARKGPPPDCFGEMMRKEAAREHNARSNRLALDKSSDRSIAQRNARAQDAKQAD